MSNFLAVATVTATLQRMLQEALDTAEARYAPGAVSGARVTALRPDSPANALPDKGVNIYLYRVSPNTAWRNEDLPARRADGSLARRPKAALELHYLLTFHGGDAELEPQRILGVVAGALHARPVLSRQLIRQTIGSPPYDALLAQSDLAEEPETVKLAPVPLSMEEVNKLWTVFSQTPYILSAFYQAEVVFIESDETPNPSLPVREPRLYVLPFRQPVIERVISQAGAEIPIAAGSTLIVEGQRMKGEATRIRIGEADFAPTSLTDTRIALPLPPASLAAGLHGLQVYHPLMMGESPAEHAGIESNIAPFVLHPEVTGVSALDVQGTGSAPRSADIRVQARPVIGKSQRVVLLLNERAASDPESHAFSLSPRAGDTDTVIVSVEGTRAGEYFVRLQVDGAESLLDPDPASPAFGPRVTIP
ncbi:MAG: DUF4255 domain-containing protein [Armatimonadetes bacterium]|nr:DUF4255 domain-containing protein [Armatimonadota bacterium]